MKQVAKAMIIDQDNQYLLLQRSDHPFFPDDPDLPGGMVETGESPMVALVREVIEEAGIVLDSKTIQKIYSGTDFSTHDTEYYLYQVQLSARPPVTISWEHASYTWVKQGEFLEQAHAANDTYMQMVYAIMSKATFTERT